MEKAPGPFRRFRNLDSKSLISYNINVEIFNIHMVDDHPIRPEKS